MTMYQLSIEFSEEYNGSDEYGILLLLCNGNFMAKIRVNYDDDIESLLKLAKTLPKSEKGYSNILIDSSNILLIEEQDSDHDIAIPMDAPGLKEALYKLYNWIKETKEQADELNRLEIK